LGGSPDTKSDQPPANTLLLFFFSGHWVEINGQDYILPRLPDGSSPTPDAIARGGIVVADL